MSQALEVLAFQGQALQIFERLEDQFLASRR